MFRPSKVGDEYKGHYEIEDRYELISCQSPEQEGNSAGNQHMQEEIVKEGSSHRVAEDFKPTGFYQGVQGRHHGPDFIRAGVLVLGRRRGNFAGIEEIDGDLVKENAVAMIVGIVVEDEDHCDY